MSIIQEALRKAENIKDKEDFLRVTSNISNVNSEPVKAAKPANEQIPSHLRFALIASFIMIFGILMILTLNQLIYIKSYSRKITGSQSVETGKKYSSLKNLPDKAEVVKAAPNIDMRTNIQPLRAISDVLKGAAAAIDMQEGPKNFHEIADAVVKERFSLSGIMYIDEGPTAIINNTVVREGDAVYDARVVKIAKSSVTLDLNGSEVRLGLR